MMKFQKVVAAVLRHDGRILIGRRKKGHRFEGLWEFPGGKIEPRETPGEALERELKEELSIVVRAGGHLCSSQHDYGGWGVELLAYEAEYVSGEIVLTDHQEVRWVAPPELKGYTFPEADRPIVRMLEERAKG
jgi:8-oxo-dGTP diphosphatase